MNQKKLVQLCQDLVEMHNQAGHDLCDEQRDFYLPRLRRMFVAFCELFPLQITEAMENAKDPWGEPLIKEE